MEEIDLEKCNFWNFRSSVTLTFDGVEVTLVYISGQGLPMHQIRSKSEKLFVDVWTYRRTDTPEFQSIRSSPGDDLKIVYSSEIYLNERTILKQLEQ